MHKRLLSVSFIGSGNVAYGLSMSLKRVATIHHIWSRNEDNANKLAKRLRVQPTNELSDLLNSDVVIVAVSDGAIKDIGNQWGAVVSGTKSKNPIIAHTSGTIGSEELNPLNLEIDYGVLYPLQTFTYGRRMSLKRVPFFIYGNNISTIKRLFNLAGLVSDSVHEMDDAQRRKLHLPAVLINNFVNHLIYKAEQVAEEDNLKLDYYIPLMEETLKKIKIVGAYKAQTGPAIRRDRSVIEAQLNRLSSDPGLKEIYTLFTESINKLYNEDHRGD